MASVKAAKRIGGAFTNAKEIFRVIYDFAQDGGAAGALTLATAQEDCVVSDFMAVVKTTCTSGGSATVQVGQTSDDDAFLTATAVASLTAGTVFQENGAFNSKMKLASGAVLTQTIATAALTAGKIEYTFELMRI
jgi:hypothetical protein